MKLSLTLALTLLVCAPLHAIDVDPKLDRAVNELMPVCSGATVKYAPLDIKLPARFNGALVTVTSEDNQCDSSFAAVIAPSGSVFVGGPWPIANEEGKTVAEKLKNFTWRNLHENMTATVDPTRTADGLFRVTLDQSTENGKMPMEGYVDADGKIFFFGRFRPTDGDIRAARTKIFEPYVSHAPTKGATTPVVTVLEFSDFQCPSCQRASGYLDPILAKHGDQVRYVRYDLPLTGHAWAFGAAMAGRAIYRQNPELFWEFKKQVYANQSSLNAFVFADWARNFAQDHDLDLKKYDADVQSDELKAEILGGAGTALSNDIRATPSYIVNGSLVDAGEGGKALAAYIEKLLAK